MYINPLQGICIIRNPKFVEIRKQAIIGASSARGTILYHYIRIFLTDTVQDFQQTEVIVNIEVVLLVLRQIERTMVLY